MYGNRFIIEHFLDHAAVGLYSVGTGLAERGVTFTAILVSAATLPLAIQDMNESGSGAAMQRLKVGSIAVLGLMIPAAVGISILATPIAEILIGPQYREAAILLFPIAATSAVIYWTWSSLAAQALILLKKTGLLVQFSSTMAILTVILSIILIQWLGILGVAYARLAALSLVFIVTCQVCISRFGMLFPGRELIKMLVCAAGMAAVLWIVPTPRTVVGLLLVTVLGAVVYLSAAVLFFRSELRPIAERLRVRLVEWKNGFYARGSTN
jgi:O-antigen/teichoic acid export membrane protein